MRLDEEAPVVHVVGHEFEHLRVVLRWCIVVLFWYCCSLYRIAVYRIVVVGCIY